MKSPRVPMIMTSLSMRVRLRSSASFPKTGRSLRKRGFTTPEDFFRKTIADKGWRALCQPPHPAATSVVQEFYANLASHVFKKVRVHGVLVNFNAQSINRYYNLDPVPSEPFDRLHAQPDYSEVIRVLTNGQGQWKLNSDKGMRCTSRPNIWPTSSRSGITSSHRVSFRRRMCVK